MEVAAVCEIKENFYTPATAAVFLVPQQLSGCALPSNEGLFNRYRFSFPSFAFSQFCSTRKIFQDAKLFHLTQVLGERRITVVFHLN